MRRLLCIILLACLSMGKAMAADTIGSVNDPRTVGATGILPEGEEKTLAHETPVFQNETVVTEKETGRTSLVFLDQTTLNVGPSSKVTLDKYVYNPSANSVDGVIRFGAGVFRYATGGIAKDNTLNLRTPITSMAIRGTELTIWVWENGHTEVTVISGLIDIWPCPEKLGSTATHVKAGEMVTVDTDCTITIAAANGPAPGPGRPASPN